jgi:DNA-binding NarL/FixJ family response regulator
MTPMPITPILLVTHDDFLWQHWRAVDNSRWLPARGRDLSDLRRWREQGRQLAVLDVGLPRLPAWKSVDWSGIVRGLRLILASPRPNDEEGTQAMGVGACGYCHGYAPGQTLSQVLEAADSGAVWMGQSLLSRLLRLVEERAAEASPGWESHLLTDREQVVARRAARGEANAEIAQALGITERTVKAHLSSIFDKLGVSDRLQLALLVHGISSKASA